MEIEFKTVPWTTLNFGNGQEIKNTKPHNNAFKINCFYS